MDMAVGVTFLSLELACLVLVLLAIVRTGFARLGSSVGIARDGFPPGKAVPSWSLPDVEGHWHVTPAGDHWQLLIFANQALASFPDLISGMNHLANSIQELEVLILAQENREDCVVRTVTKITFTNGAGRAILSRWIQAFSQKSSYGKSTVACCLT